MNYPAKTYLIWTLPFILFIVGYYLTSKILRVNELTVPRVVGLSLTDGVKALSEKKLNVRILAEREDNDLPDGTILRQNPGPLTSAKPQHSVFLVTSYKPKPPSAPDLVLSNISKAQESLNAASIKYSSYAVPSSALKKTVVAQFPQPHAPLNPKRMVLYTCAEPDTRAIMPSLMGMPIDEARDFLQLHGITASVQYRDDRRHHAEHKYVVAEQKPLPGTVIDTQHPPVLQLIPKRRR